MPDWEFEFTMVVTFIGIVVPLLQSAPMILCAAVAGAVSLLLRDLPHQVGLMFGAIAGIAAAMLCRASSFVAAKTTKFGNSGKGASA